MNINRNNYEEYFLLYIDSELSVAEKDMVEAFVAANPDLGEELVMLQQSVIKMDDIHFPGKESLLKLQPVDDATEEKLLLLLDNELPEKEKRELLQQTKNNEAVKKEWELLLQTKLSAADTIVFEDKPVLYKEETKIRPMIWWRMAAAAMLIGLGLWGTVSYLNRDTGKPDTAVNSKQHPGPSAGTSPAVNNGNTGLVIKKDNGTADITNAAPAAENNVAGGSDAITAVTGSNTNISSMKNTAAGNKVHASVKTGDQPGDDTAVQPLTDESRNTAANDLENFNSGERNKKLIASVTPETIITKPVQSIEIPASSKNEFAVNTSFNSNAGQDFETFDEEEDKPRKTKLGGFLKRVKRVIERKTKINTGNNDEVKIANMSFAVK